MAKPAQPNYQKLHDELEAILADLQRDDLDIDQALKSYERGLELVRQLEGYLNNAENKVRELKMSAANTANAAPGAKKTP